MPCVVTPSIRVEHSRHSCAFAMYCHWHSAIVDVGRTASIIYYWHSFQLQYWCVLCLRSCAFVVRRRYRPLVEEVDNWSCNYYSSLLFVVVVVGRTQPRHTHWTTASTSADTAILNVAITSSTSRPGWFAGTVLHEEYDSE